MRVQVKATGKILHVDKVIGELFLAVSDGKVAEYIEPAALKVPITWGIGFTTSGERAEEPFLMANGNGQSMNYFGRLKNPPVYFGSVCPAEVFSAYLRKRSEWNPDQGRIPGDGGEFAIRQLNAPGNLDHVILPRR
jgi:hypothetical protein